MAAVLSADNDSFARDFEHACIALGARNYDARRGAVEHNGVPMFATMHPVLPGTVVVLTDLGLVPDERALEVYKRMSAVNVALGGQVFGALCVDAATKRALRYLQLPQQAAAQLPHVLRRLSSQALAWRQALRLDPDVTFDAHVHRDRLSPQQLATQRFVRGERVAVCNSPSANDAPIAPAPPVDRSADWPSTRRALAEALQVSSTGRDDDALTVHVGDHAVSIALNGRRGEYEIWSHIAPLPSQPLMAIDMLQKALSSEFAVSGVNNCVIGCEEKTGILIMRWRIPVRDRDSDPAWLREAIEYVGRQVVELKHHLTASAVTLGETP